MPGPVFEKGAKVTRWEKNLRNPQTALKQIGTLMVAESQGSFRAQQFGKDRWEERSVPNTFGIIADFAAGKAAPPQRRFTPTPALRDTGRLASTIAYRVIGTTVVEVGSNLPYAGRLNVGGESESEKITEGVQTALSNWLSGQGKRWRGRLGWLLSPKRTDTTLTTEIPARRFVGLTKRTIEDVREAVGARIMEVK